MFDGLQQRDEFTQSFAEPLASDSFADMVTAAERRERLANMVFSADAAREQIYDQRIAAVKAATGVQLENPERGGYSLSERDLRRLNRENGGPIDPMAYRRSQFEQRLDAVRQSQPDKAEALMFPDIDAEGRTIGKQAEVEGAQPTGANPLASFGADIVGGMWAHRRDPLFIGSMFAGPVSATAKTVLGRIFESAVKQGLYNAAITAAEQPFVQSRRAEIGVRSGLVPALENTAMGFASGAVPGAVLRGIHEALPVRANAIRMGEQMVEADRDLLPPAPKDVPPPLHDDMQAAALTHADDPINTPSPQAVAVVRTLAEHSYELSTELAESSRASRNFADDGVGFTPSQMKRLLDEEQQSIVNMWHEAKEPISPDASEHYKSIMAAYKRELDRVGVWQARTEDEVMDILFEKRGERVKATRSEIVNADVDARIQQAQPRSEREAQMVASEAIEDLGTRSAVARLREDLSQPLPAPEPDALPTPAASSKDPLDRIPIADDNGNTKYISARQAAKIGARETELADLIRECK